MKRLSYVFSARHCFAYPMEKIVCFHDFEHTSRQYPYQQHQLAQLQTQHDQLLPHPLVGGLASVLVASSLLCPPALQLATSDAASGDTCAFSCGHCCGNNLHPLAGHSPAPSQSIGYCALASPHGGFHSDPSSLGLTGGYPARGSDH